MHSALTWILLFPRAVPFFLWTFCSQRSLGHSAILPISLVIKHSSLAGVHPAGEIAICQGINEHPSRTEPHQRSPWPNYFGLVNKSWFSLIVHKHRGINPLPLLHGSLRCRPGLPAPLDVSPYVKNGSMWSCVGYTILSKAWMFYIGGENIIESL